MILSEEQEKKIYELSIVSGIDYEEIKRALNNFANVAKDLWEELKDLLEPFLKTVDEYLYFDDKPDWFTPKKIVLKSQVIGRKPLARARSSC
jgi:hypothetical protein